MLRLRCLRHTNSAKRTCKNRKKSAHTKQLGVILHHALQPGGCLELVLVLIGILGVDELGNTTVSLVEHLGIGDGGESEHVCVAREQRITWRELVGLSEQGFKAYE